GGFVRSRSWQCARHESHTLSPCGTVAEVGCSVNRLSITDSRWTMSGPGFGDLAAERLRRETELDRIAALLNWGPLSYRLEKHCRKLDGRPPFPPLVMFRALLLAQW